MRFMIFLGLLLITIVQGASPLEKSPVETVRIESNAIKDPKLIIDYQLASIDRLVEMTNQTIANLNTLRRLIDDYKQKQEAYLERTDDKEKLYRMAKAADLVLSHARTTHLQDAFDPEFLAEVTMLAQIYRKISLPTVP